MVTMQWYACCSPREAARGCVSFNDGGAALNGILVGLRAPFDGAYFYLTHPLLLILSVLHMLPFVIAVVLCSATAAGVSAAIVHRPFGPDFNRALEWVALPVVAISRFVVPSMCATSQFKTHVMWAAPKNGHALAEARTVRTLKALTCRWLVKVAAITAAAAVVVAACVIVPIVLAPLIVVALPVVLIVCAVLVVVGGLTALLCSCGCTQLLVLLLGLTWVTFWVTFAGGVVGLVWYVYTGLLPTAATGELFSSSTIPTLTVGSAVSALMAAWLAAAKIYFLSTSLAQALCAQLAMRLNQKQFDDFARNRSAELFGMSFPCWCCFYAHPLLGLALLELMTGCASMFIGRLVEHDNTATVWIQDAIGVNKKGKGEE